MANTLEDFFGRMVPDAFSIEQICQGMTAAVKKAKGGTGALGKLVAGAENNSSNKQAYKDFADILADVLTKKPEFKDIFKFINVANKGTGGRRSMPPAGGGAMSHPGDRGGNAKEAASMANSEGKISSEMATRKVLMSNIGSQLKRQRDHTRAEAKDVNEMVKKLTARKDIDTESLQTFEKTLRYSSYLTKADQERVANSLKELANKHKIAELTGKTVEFEKQAKKTIEEVNNLEKKTEKAKAKEQSEETKKAIKETIKKIAKFALTPMKVATSFLPDFDNPETMATKAVKEQASWTSDISKTMFEISGATGNVLKDSNNLISSYHDIGNEVGSIYVTTGQTSDIYRKVLLKNLKRGITDLQKWDRVTKIGLSTATLIGADAEATSDEFADWHQQLRLSVGETATLSRNLQHVSRATGVTGDNLLAAVKSTKEMAQYMKNTGAYTDDVGKKLISLQVGAKKRGIEGVHGQLMRGLTGASGFFDMSPGQQSLLATMARAGGVGPDLMSGQILQDKTGKKAKAMARGGRDILQTYTGVRSAKELEGITGPRRNQMELAASAFLKKETGLKNLGELAQFIENFEEETKTATEKLTDLQEQLRKNVMTEKQKNDLEKRISLQKMEVDREAITEQLSNLGKLEDFIKGIDKREMNPEQQKKAITDEYSRITGGKGDITTDMKKLIPEIQQGMDEGMKQLADTQKSKEEELAKAQKSGDLFKIDSLTDMLKAIKDMNKGYTSQQEELKKLEKDLESGTGDPAKLAENIARLREEFQTANVQNKLQGLDTYTQAEYLQKKYIATMNKNVSEIARVLTGKVGAEGVLAGKVAGQAAETGIDWAVELGDFLWNIGEVSFGLKGLTTVLGGAKWGLIGNLGLLAGAAYSLYNVWDEVIGQLEHNKKQTYEANALAAKQANDFPRMLEEAKVKHRASSGEDLEKNKKTTLEQMAKLEETRKGIEAEHNQARLITSKTRLAAIMKTGQQQWDLQQANLKLIEDEQERRKRGGKAYEMTPEEKNIAMGQQGIRGLPPDLAQQEATSNIRLADAATKKDSIYVHDTHLEKMLQKAIPIVNPSGTVRTARGFSMNGPDTSNDLGFSMNGPDTSNDLGFFRSGPDTHMEDLFKKVMPIVNPSGTVRTARGFSMNGPDTSNDLGFFRSGPDTSNDFGFAMINTEDNTETVAENTEEANKWLEKIVTAIENMTRSNSSIPPGQTTSNIKPPTPPFYGGTRTMTANPNVGGATNHPTDSTTR